MAPIYRTVLASTGPLPTLEPTEIRLMPFHLAHTGPINTDIYFNPRPSSTQQAADGEGPTGRVAAFRGREVYEHRVAVPAGYRGYIFSAPSDPTARTEDVVPASIPEAELGANGAERSMRRRKVPEGKGRVQGRKTRGAPVQRFSLDEEDEEETEGGSSEVVVPEVVIPIRTDSQSDETPNNEQTLPDPSPDLQNHPKPGQVHQTTSITAVETLLALPSRESQPHGTPPPASPPAPEPEPEPELEGWTRTRHVVPRATFKAFTIWYPDEGMYTPVPAASASAAETDTNTAPEETEPQEGEGDARRLMGERDEYVRALDEWRRVGEVVHCW